LEGKQKCGFDVETGRCMELADYENLLVSRAKELEKATKSVEKAEAAVEAAPGDTVAEAKLELATAEQSLVREELGTILQTVPAGHEKEVILATAKAVLATIPEDDEEAEEVRANLQQLVAQSSPEDQGFIQKHAKAAGALFGSLAKTVMRNKLKTAVIVGLGWMLIDEVYNASQGRPGHTSKLVGQVYNFFTDPSEPSAPTEPSENAPSEYGLGPRPLVNAALRAVRAQQKQALDEWEEARRLAEKRFIFGRR
jgi:hypothetical protein